MATSALSLAQFDAYRPFRTAGVGQISTELEWHERDDRKVIGVVFVDKIDHDFGWVAFTDNGNGFRAADVGASVETRADARDALIAAMGALPR